MVKRCGNVVCWAIVQIIIAVVALALILGLMLGLISADADAFGSAALLVSVISCGVALLSPIIGIIGSKKASPVALVIFIILNILLAVVLFVGAILLLIVALEGVGTGSEPVIWVLVAFALGVCVIMILGVSAAVWERRDALM
eukprot:TRINITY_DN5227_c0_g2_i1.p1 TRINITY_DN5227_c0_g2~~TRINITY_DN5227_c0_g2_i1.p1  ORF type:complete len:143 (+),score=4.65 TRINITY_DN5227_c0_g2_i1:153-581(+)